MPLWLAIFLSFIALLGHIYRGDAMINGGFDMMVLSVIALWGICYLIDEFFSTRRKR